MAESPGNSRWYLFIHQLPPKPLYLRAKVRKLLAQAGALPLKDSVYVLPLRPDRLQTLEHIAAVAAADGGDAFLWEGQLLERPRQEELIASFQRARDEDYDSLVARAREWTHALETRSGPSPPEGRVRFRLAHAKRRFEQIARNDFFGASGRARAETALARLEARLQPPPSAPDANRAHADLIGRTWVTRRGIQVDRIASAWLIRRFLDPKARFRFIDLADEQARPGELTFDMIGGDFTHEQDRCTFETLAKRTGLRDAALLRVAEIIHDIDIKDGKFGRPEAPGVEQLVLGLLAANPEDERRLDRGFAMLDDLYRSFGRQLRPDSPSKGKDRKLGGRRGRSTRD
jgi:hypothetical protein